MLFFNEIKITQFRNYVFQSFSFDEKVVAICGANGSGKTNLLDALYYLCFTKSYFSRQENQSVNYGNDGFRIEGFLNDENKKHRLLCILRENKKEFLLDDEAYKKFSEHIGKFPCVMVAPDDGVLITGNSDERRKFIDTILSQLHHGYLKNLIRYNKILLQRNSLLKAAGEHNRVDENLLDTYEEQLAEAGQFIFNKRKDFLQKFLLLIKQEYETIAEKNDTIEIVFESQLHFKTMKELLKENRSRDMYLQRTGCGIHKDDLEIKMNGEAFKNTASQGQRKSLLFAMKLAEFITLKEHKGFAPILLLDDVFEKLDEQRINNLLRKVCVENDAQVFITDTHKERLENAFKNLGISYQLIELLN
jgi:DNA replication and repair protein RecF